MLRLILSLVLLLTAGEAARAQYESLPLVILNADGHNLTDDLGHAWDPEDGVWTTSARSLSLRDDLEVFVTNEVCADSIVAWSRAGGSRAQALVNGFANEYRQRGWMLTRHGETYNLQDVNPIAEAIYQQYGWIVDHWCRETGDPRGIYSVALVLHPRQSNKYELVVLTEKVTKYDGEDERCPLYYKNRVVLANVDKVHHVTTFRRQRQAQATSDGNWLTFDEHFHIQGRPSQRLVVERLIDACTFDEDYDRLDNRLDGNPMAQSLNRQLMDHHGQLQDTTYVQTPMVFAGHRFLQTRDRQMRWDLRRDTLDHYRRLTQQTFDADGRWVEWQDQSSDTICYLIPAPLWRQLQRYASFDALRRELCAADPSLPLTTTAADTAQSYTVQTRIELYQRFSDYIERGHQMADQQAIASESELRDGYVSRTNGMDVYPLRQETRRVRIDHGYGHQREGEDYPLELYTFGIDTTLHYRWQMPDARRFYQLRHINYLQDFTHADTTHTDECSCQRQMPLQFLMVSSRPATFDCPPRRHAATDDVVTFRPRERGEPMDATYQLSLSFDLGQTRIDLDRDSNRLQLERVVHKAYEITHDEVQQTIQRVTITGISSPEGVRLYNQKLSHGRSQSLARLLHDMGGDDLRSARFDIAPDSIAPWSAVADVIDEFYPAYYETSDRIRSVVAGEDPALTQQQQRRLGYREGNDPVMADALALLRKAQVSFTYKVLFETPVEQIIQRFREGGDPARWTPYYYYVLLQAPQLTDQEHLEVARQLLRVRQSEVRRFSRDMHPTDSYGLVLPMAANLLAEEAMREGRYDRSILAPFINERIGQGNIACYMEHDEETPVKFINLDVVLYNQILMLCGVGTDEAMLEAYELVDVLQNTQTMSAQFRHTYHPEWMELLLDSHNGGFLSDPAKAEQVKRTNVCNLYVVNLAQIYQQTGGELTDILAHPESEQLIEQCADSLASLQRQMEEQPAALYFTAVTEAWSALSIGSGERNAHFDRAIDALCQLFAKEAEPTYIERLQGDSYLRGVYRDARASRHGMDLYLEAVEAYIRRTVAL